VIHLLAERNREAPDALFDALHRRGAEREPDLVVAASVNEERAADHEHQTVCERAVEENLV
jgi:hypothetical protein